MAWFLQLPVLSVVHNLNIVFCVRGQVLALDSRVILNCCLGFGIPIQMKKVVGIELQISPSNAWHTVWDILNSRYAT